MISQNDGAALKALGSPIATERKKAVLPLQIDAGLLNSHAAWSNTTLNQVRWKNKAAAGTLNSLR